MHGVGNFVEGWSISGVMGVVDVPMDGFSVDLE